MEETGTAPNDTFKTILLATDGSEFSRGTERVALDMAVQHTAQVYILRLILSPPGSDEAAAEEQEAAISLEQIAEQCSQRGIPCTQLIKHSQEPSEGILEAAHEVNADLIVIGRRGRRGLARNMVGEATAKIIAQAHCSVLVVPRLVTIWSSGILMTELFSQSGEGAARAACRMARAANLPLTLLVVRDDEEDGEQKQASHLVDHLLTTVQNCTVIGASGMVETGKIEEVTLEMARQRSADLIVCEYMDDRSLMDKMLFHPPSIIHLIGQATCPVMVAK